MNKNFWLEQWKNFSLNFKEGYAHIPIKKNEYIKLAPGPGFGDGSHSTTLLSLFLLQKYVTNKTVVDIGTGSGVLAIASEKIGANKVFAYDIDKAAITHAKKNALLNHCKLISFIKPTALSTKNFFGIMNMIFLEQKIALEAVFPTYPFWITSGILPKQRDEYLSFMKKKGLKLLEEKEKDGWLGFVFSANQDSN